MYCYMNATLAYNLRSVLYFNITFSDFFYLGLGLATLGIGMVIRLIVSFLAVFRSGLNLKEMFFIPLAWFPKATVQVRYNNVYK